MIQLTRLRHGEPFFLNPDLFERIDSHVDTVVRLTNGNEYVVAESGEEIARRVVEQRARVLAFAALIQTAATPTGDGPVEPLRATVVAGGTERAGDAATERPGDWGRRPALDAGEEARR